MQSEITAPFIAINRHRLTTDGEGVTTLVAFHGCPLHCQYCLNAQCLQADGVWCRLTPGELYSEVEIDDLYFMSARVAIDRKALSEACARFGVARLRVFGSVLTDHFDPRTSDIDFLVDFQTSREDRFSDFFGLRDELTRIFGREVDLVVADSVKNPYVKSSMLQGAEDVYAA